MPRSAQPVPGAASQDTESLASVATSLLSQSWVRRGMSPSETVIRVLVVDDHPLFRAGVRSALKGVDDICVLGDVSNAAQALVFVSQCATDVAVMDLEMPEQKGLEATRLLVARRPPVRVLVLTIHSDEEQLLHALEAGASGFLPKDASASELVEAIRVAMRGGLYVRQREARRLAAAGHVHSSPVTPFARAFGALSERERAVLRLLAEGNRCVDVAHELGISNKTVNTYKQRIEAKLGLHDRTDYVRFAMHLGLLRA